MTTLATQTKSQIAAGDVAALLRARNPLIWIVTREEARVERYIFEAAASARYVARTWDIGQGTCDISGRVLQAELRDPAECFAKIATVATTQLAPESAERGVWIMRDLPVWVTGAGFASTNRQLRNLVRLLPSVPRNTAQAVVVISPSGEVPAELAGHTTVIEWPLPDRTEIAAILDAAIATLPEEVQAAAAPNGAREAAIDAAIGLTGLEAQGCYNRSLVKLRRIDPAVVASEKKRVIARERVLEWYDPIPGGLEAVGGLEILKGWLKQRANAYTPAARAYGLPSPKGVLVVGVPGTGKSLISKAISTAWQCPLLRLDLGALKSKFVGESEGKIRQAFRVVETVGKCVLWIDEIEKALQGATSGSADGGVSSDALGSLLSWMQERTGDCFVIATANDVTSLPPELLRKGRFDEIFFVDAPTTTERKAVLQAALRTNGRPELVVDLDAIARATDGFTGAEIAAIVPDAMFTAFADGGRELNTADLIEAAGTVVPLTKTAAEKVAALRTWAKGRARPATAPEAVATSKVLLDI